jgi:3'-5' exoribonuclease
MVAKTFINELQDGDRIDSVFVVRSRERRTKRDGEPFARLELGDRTGALAATAWDDADALLELAEPGAALKVRADFTVSERYGAGLTLRMWRLAEPGEYDIGDLLAVSPLPVPQMEGDLRALIATVQDPHLHALLERAFGEGTPIWERFRIAPAAKSYHQAYRHGLLEHCLTVAQGVSAMSSVFPGIDRDLAVSGALLHDIGKLDTYEFQGHTIEMTDLGKLHGEIPLGFGILRDLIGEDPGFPAECAQALLHVLLSHHGKLEFGSPVTPSTREALLVHMVDNLGGSLGSFDRIEQGLPEGERWSSFDRALAGAAHFPQGAERRAA